MTAANGSTATPTHRKLTELYAAAATHLALLAAAYPGMALQVDPMKPTLNAHGSKRSKLYY